MAQLNLYGQRRDGDTALMFLPHLTRLTTVQGVALESSQEAGDMGDKGRMTKSRENSSYMPLAILAFDANNSNCCKKKKKRVTSSYNSNETRSYNSNGRLLLLSSNTLNNRNAKQFSRPMSESKELRHNWCTGILAPIFGPIHRIFFCQHQKAVPLNLVTPSTEKQKKKSTEK